MTADILSQHAWQTLAEIIGIGLAVLLLTAIALTFIVLIENWRNE